MNASDIKKLMIGSLNADTEHVEVYRKLEEEGVNYDFSRDFTDKVIDKVFSVSLKINRQVEFFRYMNLTFYRVALTGIAAIVLLIISLYMAEGSFSLNTMLGLGDNSDESFLYLLTGN